jgi:crotonobetainyl-CoA:carnitine CoA-transferase CaiB-like acyl-CoA transferase
LNLKTEAGRELLLKLVEGADVLVEGNRPGVMKRLGLGWDAVHERNAKLVMCSITGYGQDGPFAARAGHDLNYMATAGGLGLNGDKTRPPMPLAVQVADIGGGGLQPAVAILGALVAVQRGAEGRWLDVSMTDGAVSWLSLVLAAQGAGEEIARGDQRLGGRYPCYRVFACKGGGFYSVGALEPKFWAALCTAVDRPDLIDVQFAEGPQGEAVHRAMEAVFASRTRSEWEVALAGLEVCCEPVLELDEVGSHPQIAARGLITGRKTGIEVRPAVQLRKDWRRLDPPGLGEHNAEILAEVGVDARRLNELKAQGVI